MSSELQALTNDWEKRDGASAETIRDREQSLGFEFPDDYVEFMLASNGCSGDKGEIWIEIDPIEVMAPDDKPLPDTTASSFMRSRRACSSASR